MGCIMERPYDIYHNGYLTTICVPHDLGEELIEFAGARHMHVILSFDTVHTFIGFPELDIAQVGNLFDEFSAQRDAALHNELEAGAI